MMRPSQTVLLLAIVLVTASGCKKKPKKVPPPATQVPTITAPVNETKVEPKPDSTPAPAKPPAVIPDATKTKPKPKPKPVAKKPAPTKPPVTEPAKPPAEPVTTARATPPRIVVQPGPTPSGESPTAVVPDMTHTEESHHRQTTEQLMQSTEANIKSLKRVLTAEERSLLQQIQLFMEQSREATQGQDLVRAHNLAMKAHLLSDELVR